MGRNSAAETIWLTGKLPFSSGVTAAAGSMEDTGKLEAAIAVSVAVATPAAATGLVPAVTDRVVSFSGEESSSRKTERRENFSYPPQGPAMTKKQRGPRVTAFGGNQSNCRFCQSNNHVLSACATVKEWAAENPRKRARFCARCQSGTHPARFCLAGEDQALASKAYSFS